MVLELHAGTLAHALADACIFTHRHASCIAFSDDVSSPGFAFHLRAFALKRGALNRPAALNAFTREMHHDLWAALDRAEANAAIRAVVFTGAGRGFCAGADLNAGDLGPQDSPTGRPDPGVSIEMHRHSSLWRTNG